MVQEGPVIEIPGYRNLVDDRAALATQMMKETYQIPQLPDLITSDVSSPRPINVFERPAVRCYWNNDGRSRASGTFSEDLKALDSIWLSIVDILHHALLRTTERDSRLPSTCRSNS